MVSAGRGRHRSGSAQVIGAEQSFGSSQDRVLVRVVRMVFGRDLEDGRHWCHVRVDHVSDQFGHVLVDQYYVDVVPLEERPERVLDVDGGRVLVHYQEVLGRTLRPIRFADSAQ